MLRALLLQQLILQPNSRHFIPTLCQESALYPLSTAEDLPAPPNATVLLGALDLDHAPEARSGAPGYQKMGRKQAPSARPTDQLGPGSQKLPVRAEWPDKLIGELRRTLDCESEKASNFVIRGSSSSSMCLAL